MLNWNDAEWLSTAATRLQWLATILLFFSVIAGALAFRFSSMEKRLLLEQQQRERNQLESQLDAAQDVISDLEAKQGPRSFTNQQKTILVQALSAYRGQAVRIVLRQGDTEAAAFADHFESVFQEAGWPVGGRGWIHPIYTQLPPLGVTIGMSNPETQVLPAADALINALQAIGTESRRVERKGNPPGHITLYIGQKG